MSVKIEDNSEEFLRRVARGAERGLQRSSIYVEGEVKRELGRTTGGVVPGTGGDSGVRGQYIASRPGTPPGTRSGRLRNSITHRRMSGLRWAVGTNVRYGRTHELGGTINHPGGTAYIVVGPGRARFISNKKAAELQGQGRQVKRTKPHPIVMPKRPFLVPALRKAESSGNLQRTFDAGFKQGFGGGA